MNVYVALNVPACNTQLYDFMEARIVYISYGLFSKDCINVFIYILNQTSNVAMSLQSTSTMKMGNFPRVEELVCLVTMPSSVASQQTSSGSTSCTLDLKHRCAYICGKKLCGIAEEGM